MNAVLERWNLASTDAAVQEVLPCNGSAAWAQTLTLRRPFTNVDDLFRAADETWAALGEADRQQAFDSHPRLGEQRAKAATEQSAQWSAGEQSRLGQDSSLQGRLAAANLAYEQQFGRVFLLCATGKGAPEVLVELSRRLGNDPLTELREACEQQRRITRLRLRKWLQLPSLPCEDV